jgi:hypothetical protein
MNDLVTIVEMRKTLTSMNDRLTPYSSKKEYIRYLENLEHYKKIMQGFITRATLEIDASIEKTSEIIKQLTK